MDVNRILIFDPDGHAPALAADLSACGVMAHCTADPLAAVALCAAMRFDAAVLYLDGSVAGIPLVVQVRMACPNLAVLIVTETDAIGLRVAGLSSGASDYVIRPVAADYLLARLVTAVRRGQTITPLQPMLRGNVVLDIDTGRIGDGSRWTRLTPTERQAFSVLFEHGDRPVSKCRIKKALAVGDDMSDNAVEVVIYRLRAKVRDWGMRIRTCRGMGYVLEHK